MRGFVPPDPQCNVSEIRFAVVYAPGLSAKRRGRHRFPASCVEIKDSKAQAHNAARPDKHRHAARVLGPSKSSEGQYIYYLVEWLE